MKKKQILILLLIIFVVGGVSFCIKQKNIFVDTNIRQSKEIDDTNISKIVDEVSKLNKGADEKVIREILGKPDKVINMDHQAIGRTRCEFFNFNNGRVIIFLFNNKLDYAVWSPKENGTKDYGDLIPIELESTNSLSKEKDSTRK